MKKLLALVMALTMIMTMAVALATTDDGKLTIWTWDPTFNIAAMNIAKEMYQKDHPDVEIEIQEVLSEDIETNVTIAASSFDNSPSLFLSQLAMQISFTLASANSMFSFTTGTSSMTWYVMVNSGL